jgi:hypothetical protein
MPSVPAYTVSFASFANVKKAVKGEHDRKNIAETGAWAKTVPAKPRTSCPSPVKTGGGIIRYGRRERRRKWAEPYGAS